jgi:hypothetical protein
MTQNRFGPRESAKKVFRNEVFPDDELPQLQKSSDLLWAMWEKEIPTDKQQNIQFFASLSITNAVTLQIMKRAMGNREITNDGMKFDMTTEEGKALLGKLNNLRPSPSEIRKCADLFQAHPTLQPLPTSSSSARLKSVSSRSQMPGSSTVIAVQARLVYRSV